MRESEIYDLQRQIIQSVPESKFTRRHGAVILVGVGKGVLPKTLQKTVWASSAKYGHAFGSQSHSSVVLNVLHNYSSHNYGYKTIFHLGRLTHKDSHAVERNFGLDLIQNGDLIDEDARDIIGRKGEATFAWWTLAPHTHLQLKKLGLTPRESIQILLNWSKDSGTNYDFQAALPLVSGEFLSQLSTGLIPKRASSVFGKNVSNVPGREKRMNVLAALFAKHFAEEICNRYNP